MRRLCSMAILLALLASSRLAAQSVVAANHAHRDIGEVLIFSDGPNRLVVAMDTDAGHKDGLVDQWFVLQTNGPVAETRVHLQAADIRFRDGLLRVIAQQERTVYEFAVNGAAPGAPLEPEYLVVRTEGFGLSRNVGETTLRIAPEHDRCETCESLTQDWGELGGGTGGSGCTSGGLGATSCSVTNGTKTCTITCDSVSYPCCNITSTGVNCKCYQ
jgi:hypothetical protein